MFTHDSGNVVLTQVASWRRATCYINRRESLSEFRHTAVLTDRRKISEGCMELCLPLYGNTELFNVISRAVHVVGFNLYPPPPPHSHSVACFLVPTGSSVPVMYFFTTPT